MSSLYIHIPFCLSKCNYCAFTSYPGLENIFESYKNAVITEIRNIARDTQKEIKPLETIFFGGGTPTSMPAEYLAEILTVAVDHWGIVEHPEISLEANPETVDKNYLAILIAAGFNRISFGVQSMNDAELKKIGRIHNRQKVIEVIAAARAVGFRSLNVDLMTGLPEQSLADWKHNLDSVLALEPDHLSIYQLTPEQGTIFDNQLNSGKYQLPSEDLSLAMDDCTQELTKSAGFAQYEISNYAKPEYESRHNINYWHNNEYIGVGAGAVSYLNGGREVRISDPRTYIVRISSGESVIVDTEILSCDDRFRETVIMGMRLLEGVDIKRLESRFNMDFKTYYGATLTKHLDNDMIKIENGFASITPLGRPLSNMIMADFV